MLDKLKDCFENNKQQNLLGVMQTVANIAAGVEQALGANKDKFNDVLDIIKALLDEHKKPS